MTWTWGLLAAAGFLWPDHLAGPFDGVPLDQKAEAIVIGVVFPALWWVDRRFLKTRFARACIVALLGWRAISMSAFVQDGWCVKLFPSRLYTRDQTGAPHAWDLRADWRAADPACSAIMTRSYGSFHEFPAWFFNLPPPDNNWPDPTDLPPQATVAIHVHGFFRAPDSGLLQLDKGRGVTATMRVDGGAPEGESFVTKGIHAVEVDATLTGDQWRLNPEWRGTSLLGSTMATVRRPSRVNLAVRPWSRWIPVLLVVALLGRWLASALRRLASPVLLTWVTIASGGVGLLVAAGRVDIARWGIAALAAAATLPLPRRLRNVYGAFLVVGIPWLVFVVASSLETIGRFTLYEWGNDFWMYQRFAYRIVMQGYWLEGGSPTFWFQPLYRWIVGILHLAFGDSSVGEWYFDGASLLVGAIFSFRIVRGFAGYRWGLVAASLTLAVFVLGTPQYLIGRGLSEISSAGFICMAALLVMRSRHDQTRVAIVAGLLAALGFYTRLNNLFMALGVAVFALPPRLTAGGMFASNRWPGRVSWRTVGIVCGFLTAALLLFAWRTWYYTGVFSVFYGTQRELLATWKAGMGLAEVIGRMTNSVMMVVTVNDPPHFDWFAMPVLIGAVVAVLAMVGFPLLCDVPLAPSLFFLASIAGALLTRGSAYPGRFSVHVIPITCALTTCAAASLTQRYGRSPGTRQ